MHLSRTLGIDRRDIGMAGLKDRLAITRQWVSVPRACEARLAEVESDHVRVLDSARHRNKLKTGHLHGNRFVITVEGVADGDLARAEQIRDRLLSLGVANYYGEQRFGRDEETLRLGLALLKGETSERSIPFSRRKFLTRLAISAVQSWLFNQVLAERLRDGLLHSALAGDVLQVCASGGLFVCEEPAVDQARCDQREVVITGPMFGETMKQPLEEAFAREQRVLKTSGITGENWNFWNRLAPGARRAMVIHLSELSLAQRAPESIELSFALPSGAYATSVLREFARENVDAGVDRCSS
jgi:tRNA pseudouridine13 synthase